MLGEAILISYIGGSCDPFKTSPFLGPGGIPKIQECLFGRGKSTCGSYGGTKKLVIYTNTHAFCEVSASKPRGPGPYGHGSLMGPGP